MLYNDNDLLWEEKELRFSDIDKELIIKIAKENGVTSMSL